MSKTNIPTIDLNYRDVTFNEVEASEAPKLQSYLEENGAGYAVCVLGDAWLQADEGTTVEEFISTLAPMVLASKWQPLVG